MEDLGDDRFTAGVTITQGSENAEKASVEVRRAQRRRDAPPIWVVVKRWVACGRWVGGVYKDEDRDESSGSQ